MCSSPNGAEISGKELVRVNPGTAFLLAAICSEVIGTTCMKLSQGFTRIVPSVLMGLAYLTSLSMLTFALRHIEVSVAYAIWSGVGTLLISAIGVFAFQESFTLTKAISMVLVIAGVVGLNLTTRH